MAVNSQVQAWISAFLYARSLQKPTGAPLYRYHVTEEELLPYPLHSVPQPIKFTVQFIAPTGPLRFACLLLSSIDGITKKIGSGKALNRLSISSSLRPIMLRLCPRVSPFGIATSKGERTGKTT